MGVHGISRLRLAEIEDRDITATESYAYYLGDGLFDGWGVGRAAAPLAFRWVLTVTAPTCPCLVRFCRQRLLFV